MELAPFLRIKFYPSFPRIAYQRTSYLATNGRVLPSILQFLPQLHLSSGHHKFSNLATTTKRSFGHYPGSNNPFSLTYPLQKRLTLSKDRCSNPARKAPKLSPCRTLSHVDESAEDDIVQNVSRQDASVQEIIAEARGVTRKNVPWNEFHSLYLRGFSVKAQPKSVINSVKKIGTGEWEEELFWDRLHKVFSNKVLGDLKLFYGGTKTFSDADKGKEVPSKPDFVLHTGNESPNWADVELLFEHTRSSSSASKVTEKFLQWLRCAWSVFHHQPFRRHLYGIMFIKPHAFVCYADHGCAVYSEPLSFGKNLQHTRFLTDFLMGFITNPGCRGSDPTVEKTNGVYVIRHAGRKWIESSDRLLCYRPNLIGRHIRVAVAKCQNTDVPECQNTDVPEAKVVMKSTWEEILPSKSSPPSEVEVLRSLFEAKVRGLPQPYDFDKAIVRDNGETGSFPKNGNVALQAQNKNSMKKIQVVYLEQYTPEPMAPGTNIGKPLRHRIKIPTPRQQFNKPLKIRRRLTRILTSYCRPLKEVMRSGGPKKLMPIIRDAMIVYYEAYKLPESGFIQGDISIENIVVPTESSELTGGLTYKDRRGTIVDWNLCFTANGTSPTRAFSSGTPVFMAPILLGGEPITRRTLRHDMESFFAVIIWIATLGSRDEGTFQSKPLARTLLNANNTPENITDAKMRWFANDGNFVESIITNFDPCYMQDTKFHDCMLDLREILYPTKTIVRGAALESLNKNNNAETGGVDPAEEGLFQMCMGVIDKYLQETKGCDEMQLINSQVLLRNTGINS